MVEEGVKNYIDNNIPKEDIRKFLHEHERKAGMIENLTNEILNIELCQGLYLTKEKIDFLVKDIAKMFCQFCIQEKIAKISVNIHKHKTLGEMTKAEDLDDKETAYLEKHMDLKEGTRPKHMTDLEARR